MKKNVLLIGNGGREHALGYALSKSPTIGKLYVQEGNIGLSKLGEVLRFDPCQPQYIFELVQSYAIHYVIIGSEVPLASGVSDYLSLRGVAVFAPSRAAAQLEISKAFTKNLCTEKNIPTAAYQQFDTPEAAFAYIDTHSFPLVIKADGLAAGKGVIIAQNKSEAQEAITQIMSGQFGDAGKSIVIEEFLEGEEVSFFVMTDGKTAIPFGTAQDHKRIGEGDTGANTGGMGAYSPAPMMNDTLTQKIMKQIIEPTLEKMRSQSTPFIGILYAGLMIDKEGNPFLIEYNVRFGDPECQVLMMRLKSDLLELIIACCKGQLNRVASPQWLPDSALTVVLANNGYPVQPIAGDIIEGLDIIPETEAIIFHAGTELQEGQVIARGGRVLNVTARGKNVCDAAQKAYQAVDKIRWNNMYYRKDIGYRAIRREQQKVA